MAHPRALVHGEESGVCGADFRKEAAAAWLQALRKAEGGLSLGHLMEPALSLALSSALGCGYGVLIGRLLAVPARAFSAVMKRLPPATAGRRGRAPLPA